MNQAGPLDFQFFPTPRALGIRMWEKFKSRNVTRCLEPSCGNADLLLAGKANSRMISNGSGEFSDTVDVCEIDMSKHAHLRELGLNVVGMDFLDFTNGSVYSHVILNPPFSDGAKHVLHAWDILWDGEIVALLNAETLRNPFSAERQLLSRLVSLHGEVEYLQGAFMTNETARKTEVECALVYLRKKAEASDLLHDLLDDLKEDRKDAEQMTSGYERFQDLALPNSVVENQVLMFNASVKAWREAILAEGRATQYELRIGATMEESNGNTSPGGIRSLSADVQEIRKSLDKKYRELKNRAWTSILRGSQVTSKLSSAAQKRVESDFERIKTLEFTVSNIYGFLLGIAESAGEIQLSMMCDVFDNIVRYHSENAVFYRGWKSNDHQRRCGMRVKMRRFILPGFEVNYSLGFQSRRRLDDFDRVFAILDGKSQPEVSLGSLFDNFMDDLKYAKRLSSSYFDIRFYKGIQTIHFFPRRADLMDRLNRLVGKHRSWLPPVDPSESAKDFWKQYDQAETFDRELREAISKDDGSKRSFGWRGPLALLACSNDKQSGYRPDEIAAANALVDGVAAKVQLAHGINADNILEFDNAPLLLAA